MREKLYPLLISAALGLAAVKSPAAVFLSDSFSYGDGALTNGSGGKWILHSGNGSGLFVSNGQAQVSQALSDDCNALLLGGPFEPAKTNLTFYVAFKVTFTTLPASFGYFAHFKDGGTTFKGKVFATNSAGQLRLGIANGGTSTNGPNQVTGNLSLGTPYRVVLRYNLNAANAQTALGLNPASEADLTLAATDSATVSTATAFALRQLGGEGVMQVDDLIIASTFAEANGAWPGATPFFVRQPQNTNVVVGSTVTLSVVAGGDGLTYQWRKNGADLADGERIAGATSPDLTLSSLTTNEAGSYLCFIANAVAGGPSQPAVLTVVPPAPVAIVADPTNTVATVGNTVTLRVSASGSPPLSYQWYFNEVPQPGATASNLVLNNVQFTQAGQYYATVANPSSSATSQVATLTVNAPVPIATTIAYLHSLQDTNAALTNTTTYFTVEGVVITWANLTGSTGVNTNSLFYIQDATGGLAVFWRGVGDGQPPAGARVRVTGKLEQYNGLTELVPQVALPWTGVTVLSLDNPLPAPAPFDYSWLATPAVLEAREGSLLVVSNVVFDSAFTTFDSVSAGINFTNTSGQSFVLYVNKYTDLVGQPIPAGPCTIVGVLGQFDSASPYTNGYQLIPSRYADIASDWKAPLVRFTNTLSNLVRSGQALVSAFNDYGLRPGERLHAEVTVGDGSGEAHLRALTAGLPSNVVWHLSDDSGLLLRASFDFVATPNLAGLLTPVVLRVWNSRVTNDVTWKLYVPTADEQQVAISEVLPNPTTNAALAQFNPLRRAAPQDNAFLNDEYVEIANLSGQLFDLYNWTLADAVGVRHTFWNGSYADPQEVLPPHGAIIVYGGPRDRSNPPGLSVGVFPADAGTLALNDSGGETLTLRNQDSNVIDRVYYSEGSPLGSLTRFPNLNGSLQPQAYTGTNVVSPGTQFNGATFAQPAPALTNLALAASSEPNRNLTLNWTSRAGSYYSLWQASEAAGPYGITSGTNATSAATRLTVTNNAPRRFFRVTTP